jgi:hypothetical protein
MSLKSELLFTNLPKLTPFRALTHAGLLEHRPGPDWTAHLGVVIVLINRSSRRADVKVPSLRAAKNKLTIWPVRARAHACMCTVLDRCRSRLRVYWLLCHAFSPKGRAAKSAGFVSGLFFAHHSYIRLSRPSI